MNNSIETFAELQKKAIRFFPSSVNMQNQYIRNIKHLTAQGRLNGGGWLVPGGMFMPGARFSVFSKLTSEPATECNIFINNRN